MNMEIVLGALIDWLHKTLKNFPFLKWCLVVIVFAFSWWIAYIEWAY